MAQDHVVLKYLRFCVGELSAYQILKMWLRRNSKKVSKHFEGKH